MIRIIAALAFVPLLAAQPLQAQDAAPRPAALSAIDVVKAMPEPERIALQSGLAWTGHYNGAISGEVGPRTIAGIKAFQKTLNTKQTGILNPQERSALTAAARKLQQDVGWTIYTDPATGTRLGLPLKRTPRRIADAGLTTWNSPQDTIQIRLMHRREADLTTAVLAERERQNPAGRKISYATVKPDFFVITGMQGLKKFYVRGHLKGDQVRILTILYDQATEGTMEPVVIAMSSAFNPFPAAAAPVKTVDYSTGVIVSADGAIVTALSAATNCNAIVVPPFGNASKVAEDKTSGLALLRVYGRSNFAPMPARAHDTKPGAVELIGIADPQLQNGGTAITRVKAQVAISGSMPGNALALSPAPPAGFSGAAIQTTEGAFAGIANDDRLIPAKVVQNFLGKHDVTGAQSGGKPADSIVRVICVRK